MTSWYIIDANGARQIPQSPNLSFEQWPAFSLLSVKQDYHLTASQLLHILDQNNLLSHSSLDQYTHSLYLHHHQDHWTIAAEKIDDPDSWTLTPELASQLAELVRSPVAYLSHDTDTGSLLLDLYEDSALWLRWQDSLDPCAHSGATHFGEDGTCTLEDSRSFALRMLNLPPQTPTLDRYHFVEFMLSTIGLENALSILDNEQHEHVMQVHDLCAFT